MDKNTLMVDVGNTTVDLRWTSQNTNEIIALERFWSKDTKFQTLEYLISIFRKVKNLEQVVFSSVVPEWTELIKAAIQAESLVGLEIKKDFLHELDNFQGINFEKLGADFVANYYAVKEALKLNEAIVISLGTATTFFVIKDRKFQGAAIAPGIKISLNSLIQNAAMLKGQDFNYNEKILGLDTKTAIEIGTINGHLEMINSRVDKLKEHFKINEVIVTGGNAQVLEEQLIKSKYHFQEDLIFLGLQWLVKNKNSK